MVFVTGMLLVRELIGMYFLKFTDNRWIVCLWRSKHHYECLVHNFFKSEIISILQNFVYILSPSNCNYGGKLILFPWYATVISTIFVHTTVGDSIVLTKAWVVLATCSRSAIRSFCLISLYFFGTSVAFCWIAFKLLSTFDNSSNCYSLWYCWVLPIPIIKPIYWASFYHNCLIVYQLEIFVVATWFLVSSPTAIVRGIRTSMFRHKKWYFSHSFWLIAQYLSRCGFSILCKCAVN